MHIKKINQNQIQFTLEPEDLDERDLSLKELTYGSEKAYELFEEILENASENFDFHPENNSVMIEAVPLSRGRLLLTVTKVDEPDELDTRFSKFSSTESPSLDNLDSIDTHKSAAQSTVSSVYVYEFKQLDFLIEAAHVLSVNYHGLNSLFKDDKTNTYYLIVTKTYHSIAEFSKCCNILSEYGTRIPYNAPYEAFFTEHYTCIVKDTALQRLSKF